MRRRIINVLYVFAQFDCTGRENSFYWKESLKIFMLLITNVFNFLLLFTRIIKSIIIHMIFLRIVFYDCLTYRFLWLTSCIYTSYGTSRNRFSVRSLIDTFGFRSILFSRSFSCLSYYICRLVSVRAGRSVMISESQKKNHQRTCSIYGETYKASRSRVFNAICGVIVL